MTAQEYARLIGALERIAAAEERRNELLEADARPTVDLAAHKHVQSCVQTSSETLFEWAYRFVAEHPRSASRPEERRRSWEESRADTAQVLEALAPQTQPGTPMD